MICSLRNFIITMATSPRHWTQEVRSKVLQKQTRQAPLTFSICEIHFSAPFLLVTLGTNRLLYVHRVPVASTLREASELLQLCLLLPPISLSPVFPLETQEWWLRIALQVVMRRINIQAFCKLACAWKTCYYQTFQHPGRHVMKM